MTLHHKVQRELSRVTRGYLVVCVLLVQLLQGNLGDNWSTFRLRGCRRQGRKPMCVHLQARVDERGHM